MCVIFPDIALSLAVNEEKLGFRVDLQKVQVLPVNPSGQAHRTRFSSSRHRATSPQGLLTHVLSSERSDTFHKNNFYDKKQVYRRRYESRCIKNQKNKIRRRTIFNMADRILTPCNVAQSWHWFRQVSAPCNVACGSGIVTVNSLMAAPDNAIRGSGMTCHWIRPNVRHIGILHLV